MVQQRRGAGYLSSIQTVGMSRLLIAVCLLLQAQTSSVVRLYPVDDTERDPAFRSFVKHLQSAVDAHSAHEVHHGPRS